jgi:tetratricopeptide (TPR) repeat protein
MSPVWTMALLYDSGKETRGEAIDAYHRCLEADPQHAEALLNCGTLYYEDGKFEKAAEYFRHTLAAQLRNPLAHSNLGSVLEELGKLEEARRHLRRALMFDPNLSDAHYNLAFVCEKLGAIAEARDHWQAYIRLDPASPWSNHARQQLATRKLPNPPRLGKSYGSSFRTTSPIAALS